jgi:hypothetical protein
MDDGFFDGNGFFLRLSFITFPRNVYQYDSLINYIEPLVRVYQRTV